MGLKKALVHALPEPLYLLARRIVPEASSFSGRFGSFEEATAHASGYPPDYAVNFDPQPFGKKGEFHWRLQHFFAALACVHARIGRPLSVLDYGGAQGAYGATTREHLPGVIDRWTVLEQPQVVAAFDGRFPGVEFTADRKLGQFDLAFASGVLQYTADPYAELRWLCAHARYVIVTRWPLLDEAHDICSVQHVRAKSSYSVPIWLCSRPRALLSASNCGDLLWHWDLPADRTIHDGRYIHHDGMLIACQK